METAMTIGLLLSVVIGTVVLTKIVIRERKINRQIKPYNSRMFK